MKSFHFSLGNSTDGPIGFCARVNAPDMDKAVQILKNAIEWFNNEINICKATGLHGEFENVEYIEVYFNPSAITWQSIDEEEEIPLELEAK